MKIPKKLKIGGHSVKVVFTDRLPDNDCGYADFENDLIKIDAKLSQSMKEITLIHEIFHWINSDFHSDGVISHSLLESLSQQFYQVLKDNRLLK